MNMLRNIFTSRAINILRQNGQNALINITQPLDNSVTNSAPVNQHGTTSSILEKHLRDPHIIPKSILDATTFTGKFSKKSSNGSISPTTLKNYRRIARRIEIVYRCKLCDTRNVKQVSEVAYTTGVVILQCDGCSVNHLIVDNLGWFSNTKGKTFDEVLAENGDSVKIIKVDENGQLI